MFYDHFAGIKFRLGMAIALNIAENVNYDNKRKEV